MKQTPMTFKQNEEAVSPVIGVILMVAITVVMAALVFVLVSDLTEFGDPAPDVQFVRDSGDLVVFKAPSGLDWSEFTVNGCTAPTGALDAGDRLTACTGNVTVTHVESNTLIYSGAF